MSLNKTSFVEYTLPFKELITNRFLNEVHLEKDTGKPALIELGINRVLS